MKRIISIVLNPFTHDSRVLKECLSLKKSGYDVMVIAMHESQLPEHDSVEGIPVHRIRIRSRNWSKNRFIQVLKYLEFIWRVAWKYARKADAFHCNDVAPLPIAVLSKWFFNRKLKIVYDAHELEFDKAESGSNYFPQWAITFAEKTFIRRAHQIITVSPLIAKAYQDRYGIQQPAVVMNCPNLESPVSHNLLRAHFNLATNDKIFLYQGGLIPKRGVELLIQVFQDLDPSLQLIFLGFGPLTELVKSAEKQYPNIHFHPAVSPLELHAYTSGADVGFCIYQGRTGNHQLTIGNKIFQYIMAGVPVLASDLQGLKYVLKDERLGTIIQDFRDKAAVRSAILKLSKTGKEHRKPAFETARNIFNWEAQERIFLDVYKALFST